MSHAALASLLPLPVIVPLGRRGRSRRSLARLHRRLPLVDLAARPRRLALAVLLVDGADASTAARVHRRTTWATSVPVDGHVLGIAFAADPFGLTFALAAAAIGALLLLYTLSELRDLGRRASSAASPACSSSCCRADRIRADRRPVQPVRLVRGRRAGQLRADRLLPGAADRARGRVQDPRPDHARQLLRSSSAPGCSTPSTARSTSRQLHLALAAHAGTPDMVALGLLVAGSPPRPGWSRSTAGSPTRTPPRPARSPRCSPALMVNLGIVAIARIALQIYGPARHARARRC